MNAPTEMVLTDGTRFDYAALEAESRIVVQQKTAEIRDRAKNAAENFVAIGERLLIVKGHLEHGQFGDWIRLEFDWSESLARKMMAVATKFKTVNFTDLMIAPSALSLLASDSVPEEVRQEVIETAKRGKRVTHKEVKDKVKASSGGKKKDAAAPPAEKPKDTPPPEVTAPALVVSATVEIPVITAEPKPDAPAWDEFEKAVRAEFPVIRGVADRLRKALDYDTDTKRVCNPWAHFLSYAGTVGQLLGVIRNFEEGLPAAASEKPPGYIPARSVKAHAAFEKRKGLAHA